MKIWRTWHKWLGLAVGLQVLLWVSGGVVMSIIPIEMVRGQHLADRQMPVLHALPKVNLSVSQWRKVEWLQRIDGPILHVIDWQGTDHWLTPDNRAVAPLTEFQIQQVASQVYLGDGQVAATRLLREVPSEVAFLTPPVYRVDFDDWVHTSLYLHPQSGQIVSVRSDWWRFYDFFWMLHILDFEAREDFNHPLLISLALLAWLFTFSGLVLLYHTVLKPSVRKWRYRLSQ